MPRSMPSPLRAGHRLALALLLLAGTCHAADADTPSAAPARIAPWTAHDGRTRPLVAVVGDNAGTELVDFVVPYGIVAESGTADVVTLATRPGPLQLRPALRIQPSQTIAEFDLQVPQGADYVIVPAVTEEHVADPALLAWLRAQAGKGATIVSICDGALVAANAGLFDGHRATGHWATRERRAREHPATHWEANVRWVADGKVVSSAGVSAAVPAALALVEAIGGTEAAQRTATRLGAADWSTRHDSDRFHIGAGTVFTYVGNRWLSFGEPLALPVADGVDDIALALTADAYGRTMRSPLAIRTPSAAPVRSSHGLVLLPPEHPAAASARELAPFDGPPLQALDAALADIARHYGDGTRRYVALEMEYPAGYGER